MTLRWSLDTDRLERTRIIQGWTRGELARRARVDPATVGSLLNGQRRPQLVTIQRVAAALNLSLVEVIRFEDEPETSWC